MITIKDVSRLSGFSVTTVSKALNNYPDIAKKTKEHIKKICDEVGYIPNATAQSLVRKKSYTLGVVFEEITGVGLQHPLFSKILESFKSEVEKKGYDIMFLSNVQINGNQGSYYQHSLRKQIEGVLVLCAEFNSKSLTELYQGVLPIVMIDYNYANTLNITSNNEVGMTETIKHLKSLNHKKIANIHGTTETYIGSRRLDYFVKAMEDNGLVVDKNYLADGNFFTRESGFKAMNEILKLKNQPTAICCASDMLAIGAMQAIKKAGKKVPRDYSVVGFDGIDAGQLISPLLTTVKQDTEAIGKKAAKEMLKMVCDKKYVNKAKTIKIDTKFLEGETTRNI